MAPPSSHSLATPQGGRPPTDRQSRIRGGKLDRAPKALPPRKASCAEECERLEQLPNIGPSIAADLRALGIVHPRELAGRDALQLYQALCRLSGKRQDPCVLDTFMAATAFMGGGAALPWWAFTAERKAKFGVL